MKFKNSNLEVLKIILLLIPLIVSVALLIIMKISGSVTIPPGLRLSPVDNRPLFVSLIIFSVGYLFFLGMLFSDNLLNLLNRRRSIYKR